MATVKNFGLAGVSSDVQFGKGKDRIKHDVDHFTVRNTADTDFVEMYVKTPTGTSNANAATTKEYVDSVAAGLDPKESVKTATTVTIPGFVAGVTSDLSTITIPNLNATYFTGGVGTAAVIDGFTLALNDRVLVKNQGGAAAHLENGIYYVTAVGAQGTTDAVLNRTTDFDGTPANEVSGGGFTFVEDGVSFADTGWVVSAPTGNAVVDTTAIQFTQFSSAGLTTVTGTAGEITVVPSGNDFTISIDNTYAGQTSITTLGTVATGTWQGTTVGVAFGGTGQTVKDNVTDAGSARVTVTGGTSSYFGAGTDLTLDVNEANLNLASIGGSLGLTTQVTGVLPVANGGSGTSSMTANGIVYGSGTAAAGVTAAGTDGQIVRAGVGGTPEFSTLTMPSTVAANSLFVANAANTLTALTATDAAGNQLMQWNDTTNTFEFVTTSSVGGAKYSTITGDTGSATAAGVTDTIAMTGGSGITTVAAEGTDSVTFNLDVNSLTAIVGTVAVTDTFAMYDASALGNVKVTAQDIVDAATINVFTSITGDTGSAAVDAEADGLNFSGGEGIVTVASNPSGVADVAITLDLNEIAVATPIATDELVFADGGATNGKVAISTFISTFGIVEDADFATQGIMTSNGAGAYTMRSVVASPVAGDQGISVTGGDGTTDITIGLDVLGLTAGAANLIATDEIVVYNGTNNVKMTGAELAAGVNALTDDDRIVSVDGFNSVIANDVGTITIAPETAAGAAAATPLATFENVVDSMAMNFTNATGEVRLEAGDATGFGASAVGNVDIRFVPGLNGEVFFGEAGTDATISASNTATNGENMIILGGDGASGTGGNISLTPGTGTITNGVVNITDSASLNVMSFTGVATAVTSIDLTNAATGGTPTFSVVSTDTNVDMTFVPKGTGVLSVAGTTNYEANVVADDDIPNKLYVDNVAAAVLSGSIGSFKFTVPLNADGNTDPVTSTIPAGATITKVMVNVGVADATATLTIGTTAGGAEYADATTNDPASAGLYVADTFSSTVGAIRAVVAASSLTAGATADVIVEYKNA